MVPVSPHSSCVRSSLKSVAASTRCSTNTTGSGITSSGRPCATSPARPTAAGSRSAASDLLRSRAGRESRSSVGPILSATDACALSPTTSASASFLPAGARTSPPSCSLARSRGCPRTTRRAGATRSSWSRRSWTPPATWGRATRPGDSPFSGRPLGTGAGTAPGCTTDERSSSSPGSCDVTRPACSLWPSTTRCSSAEP